jgi:hypothetical protein
MQSLFIPTSIWINLVLLVGAAIFVRVKLGKTAPRRQTRHEERGAPDIRHAAPR